MFYVILVLILIFILCIVYKVKIKFKTFLSRGFLPKRGNFGIYCYCGKQGTGKTYSVVEYLYDNRNNITVFCNIAGISCLPYFWFKGFEELIKLKEIIDYNVDNKEDYDNLYKYILTKFKDINRAKLLYDLLIDHYERNTQLIFVYDEIFTELQKGDKLSKPIIDFLCQMRKRKIIFLTTAQEWAEIPLSFRRFCRFEIDCHMYNFFLFGILWKNFKDAENMKWSNDDQEHVAPLVNNTITKTRRVVSDSYNTFLRISSVQTENS